MRMKKRQEKIISSIARLQSPSRGIHNCTLFNLLLDTAWIRSKHSFGCTLHQVHEIWAVEEIPVLPHPV